MLDEPLHETACAAAQETHSRDAPTGFLLYYTAHITRTYIPGSKSLCALHSTACQALIHSMIFVRQPALVVFTFVSHAVTQFDRYLAHLLARFSDIPVPQVSWRLTFSQALDNASGFSVLEIGVFSSGRTQQETLLLSAGLFNSLF